MSETTQNSGARFDLSVRDAVKMFGDFAAVDGVSLDVESGRFFSILGPSGCGKTTLLRMIAGFIEPTRGRIEIRGRNMAGIPPNRRPVNLIFQQLALFPMMNVEENIAFGCPDADHEDIVEAAKAAQAHDFITDFDEGYQTVIGERGATLSGGQAQRLALARAFLTEPAILILDDATSAIDSETEDRIQRAIERAAEGRTTFLITHRLSQIRWADLIVVMRKGTVAAVGDHAQLMQESPAYRKIFARYEH